VRSLRRVLVVVVVLVLLTVVVDVASRKVAEQRVAAQLQATQRLPARPAVTIGGLSFLGQAMRGSFDAVTITTGDVPPERVGLALSAVDAHLYDVSLPLADLVAGRVTSLPVRDVQARVEVAFTTLAAAVSSRLPSEITGVSLARTASGQLLVRGRYTGSGVVLDLQAAARLTVRGRNLVVTTPEANLTAVPAPLRPLAARLLTTQVPLPLLPDGLSITGVAVEPTGLTIAVAGRGVRLRGY
jgi:LmeA-like phospholipid-binding